MLGTPNDRYINDAQDRPGGGADADARRHEGHGRRHDREPVLRQAQRREFGLWLAGWGSDTGEMSAPLKPLVATPNKDKGMGTTNPGGYSNPKMDALLDEALGTIDDGKRAAPARRGEPRRHGRLRRRCRCISR